MRSLTKKTISFLTIFLAIGLGITSCVYTAYVRVTGNITQTVTFTFFKSSEDDKPSKFNIVDVTVQEQSTDSQWITVWDLNGTGASLSEIKYGMKYEGLNEVVPAKPFKLEAQYRILISGTTWPAPGLGKAGAVFFFGEDGRVIQK